MGHFLICLLVDFPHNFTCSSFGVSNHSLFYDVLNFRKQNIIFAKIKLMSVNSFELFKSFIHLSFFIPLKSNINWAVSSFLGFKSSVFYFAKCACVTTKTKEYEFLIYILLFVNSEHYLLKITELTVRVNRIEYICKRPRKISEIKIIPCVFYSFFFFFSQCHIIQPRVDKVLQRI